MTENLLELTATYNLGFGEHPLVGYSYQENRAQNEYMANWDFPTDLLSYNNIGIGNALKPGRATGV